MSRMRSFLLRGPGAFGCLCAAFLGFVSGQRSRFSGPQNGGLGPWPPSSSRPQGHQRPLRRCSLVPVRLRSIRGFGQFFFPWYGTAGVCLWRFIAIRCPNSGSREDALDLFRQPRRAVLRIKQNVSALLEQRFEEGPVLELYGDDRPARGHAFIDAASVYLAEGGKVYNCASSAMLSGTRKRPADVCCARPADIARTRERGQTSPWKSFPARDSAQWSKRPGRWENCRRKAHCLSGLSPRAASAIGPVPRTLSPGIRV